MLQPLVRAVDWRDGKCVLLDQRLLPVQESYLECVDFRRVVDAIRCLSVRGAPALGVAGGFAAVLAFHEIMRSTTVEAKSESFRSALQSISEARPTAVNLKWAIRRMEQCWARSGHFDASTYETLLCEARCIQEEDIAANRRMAVLGASWLQTRTEVVTYCNTGDLATGGIGTAFGVIRQAYAEGKISLVYCCETRPVLQGMRLTAWELERNRIPFRVICDNMAGLVLRGGTVGAVFLGADRIARNGDVANKVGTYGLAVLANHHHVPFVVVAPTSTFDAHAETGRDIPIEERSPVEITGVLGSKGAPSFPAINPAFDVTPHPLITSIVCETGIIAPVNEETVKSALELTQANR